MHDLAIITVSTNEAHWLRPCLSTVFSHIGEGITVDVVVVENIIDEESRDETPELVATEFPAARVVPCEDLGFGHANNRALMTCDARYVLFLNPDTEILQGTFAEMVALMDARPEVGMVSVPQETADGELYPTIRRFPNALRAFGDALGAERLPNRPAWLGERELDLSVYDRELDCDWTTGAYMLVRREALESAGFFDERFFMYCEETDLCHRIKTQGWQIRHLPQMRILHHAGKGNVSAKMESLGALNRMLYARKHFSPVHRAAYGSALYLRHAARAVYAGSGELGTAKREASREVIATLRGRRPVPFAEITSPVAVSPGAPALRSAAVPTADAEPLTVETA